MDLIPACEINYGVCFQFKKGGEICVANHRYISNGYKLMYFMKNKFHCAKYKSSENARNRFLILREDLSGSATQRNRLKIKKFNLKNNL